MVRTATLGENAGNCDIPRYSAERIGESAAAYPMRGIHLIKDTRIAPRRAAMLAAAIWAAAPTTGVVAQISGTWVPSNFSWQTWSDTSIWTSSPQYPDGGGEATLRSDSYFAGLLNVDVDPTLSRLVLDAP